MVLTINGTDHELNFGVRFVRELDKKYYVESQGGIKFGTGIETRVPMLLTGDAVTLAEFIYTALATDSKKKPTMQDIDNYVDHVEDIEALFDEVIEELKKQNATKMKMKEFTDRLKQEEKKPAAEVN